MRTKFEHGERSRLSEASGVSRTTITYLFKNRTPVGRQKAVEIAQAARAMGLDLDRMDCLFPEESKNPLFEGAANDEN